jgi:hypothetical protein
MMNSITWLTKVCVALLVVFSCGLCRGDNLLLNPSFEVNAGGGLATNWTSYNDGYLRSATVSTDGVYGCKVTDYTYGNGGAYQTVSSGLPDFEKFKVSYDIYVASYTQGRIYSAYVTIYYTDSTEERVQPYLTSSEISANGDTWVSYSSTFSTDKSKTIDRIRVWCLVWQEGTDDFIGTVYYDNIKLEIFKPYLYWKGDRIYTAIDNDAAAADVLDRGFTHVMVSQHDNSTGDRAVFLGGKGFEVVKGIGPTRWEMDFTPRYFSPYNDKTNYDAAKVALADMLDDFPELTGISDDIEHAPLPEITYSTDGVASTYTFSDLEERIGNQTAESSGWPVFKDWPATDDHDVSNLTMENIEFNFPSLSVDISGTSDTSMIIGYYGTNFTYQSYEMTAQTFKPVDARITRIDVMVRRMGSSTVYPLGELNYYLTGVDANGKPDLNNKLSPATCLIRSNEIDYSSSSWSGIEVLPLYFDPVAVGELDTSKQYAVVLEFNKKDSNDWNNAYYYAAGFSTDTYNDGQAWRSNNGSWISTSVDDLWIKVYKPNPAAGFALNQFHEDWVDFQCAVMGRFVEDYRSIADSASPVRDVWIYSGYAGHNYKAGLHNYDGTIRSAYMVDWEVLAAAGIDFAVCGYGTKSITATTTALSDGDPSNPPKLIGGGYEPYGETSFLERCDTCDGGMYFYLGHYADDLGWSIP